MGESSSRGDAPSTRLAPAEPAPGVEPSARAAAVMFETLFEKERTERLESDRAGTARLARLEERLAALEAKPSPMPPAPRDDGLSGRIEGLELRLAALEAAPRGDPPPDPRPAEPEAVPARDTRTVGDPALDAYLRDIESDEPSRRATAIMGLFQAKDPRTVPHLVRALDADDPLVQGVAARTLGEIGDESALPDLERTMLSSPRQAARMNAAEAVGRIGRSSSVPRLIDALADPEARVRLEAVKALRRMTGQDLGFDPDASDSARLEAIGRWVEWERSRR